MRHLRRLAALQIPLLARGVGVAAVLAALVLATGSAKAGGPGAAATRVGAVAVAVVAERAEKEDLTAGRQRAGDQTKRIHASRGRREVDELRGQCDDSRAASRPVIRHEGSELALRVLTFDSLREVYSVSLLPAIFEPHCHLTLAARSTYSPRFTGSSQVSGLPRTPSQDAELLLLRSIYLND